MEVELTNFLEMTIAKSLVEFSRGPIELSELGHPNLSSDRSIWVSKQIATHPASQFIDPCDRLKNLFFWPTLHLPVDPPNCRGAGSEWAGDLQQVSQNCDDIL